MEGYADRHLTVHSGFLDNLKYGDLVLADRRFDISDDLALIGASLSIPPFTRGKAQLSQREVETARSLSGVRIHVERAIAKFQYSRTLLLPCSLNCDHLVTYSHVSKRLKDLVGHYHHGDHWCQ